jgi:hypothetical protein
MALWVEIDTLALAGSGAIGPQKHGIVKTYLARHFDQYILCRYCTMSR